MSSKQLCAFLLLWSVTFLPVRSFRLTLKRCTSSRNLDNQEVTQTLANVKDIHHFSNITSAQVCEMKLKGDISYLPNGLFQNFSRLKILSLPGNGIHNISVDAFLGLQSLENLDLSGNPIQDWDTSRISSQTPNLKTLDVTSFSSNFTSYMWKTASSSSSPLKPLPWNQLSLLLALPHLQEIHGVNWNLNCMNCSLIRSTNKTQISTYLNDTHEFLENYACRTKMTSPSQSVRRLASYGFLATCILSNQKCYESEVKVIVMAPCRETTLSVMYIEFVLGPLAIILNILVIATVVNSKRLRRHQDMLLVTNIAMGDFCNGVYSILIVSFHATRTFLDMETFAQSYCSYVGSFWILGLSLSVSFSVVLTIERFKCVVRITNRLVRLSAMELLFASSLCWLLALSATILPAFGIGYYNLNTYCIPVFPVTSIPVQFYYSITVAGASVLMYLITIPMYFKMYFFVRKSCKNMRVRADIELAKRVFTLVLTNFLFFLLPAISSLVFSRVKRHASGLSREVSEVLNSALPLLCLTINSVLNPVLYCFRSRVFRSEVANWSCRVPTKAEPSSLQLANVRTPHVIETTPSYI